MCNFICHGWQESLLYFLAVIFKFHLISGIERVRFLSCLIPSRILIQKSSPLKISSSDPKHSIHFCIFVNLPVARNGVSHLRKVSLAGWSRLQHPSFKLDSDSSGGTHAGVSVCGFGAPTQEKRGGGGNVCNSNREKNWTQRISIVVSVAGSLQQGHKAEKPNPQISSIPARASCGGARPAVPRPAAGVEMGGL